MKIEEALESLRLKFTSGNDVSVKRATITREEYEAIRLSLTINSIEHKAVEVISSDSVMGED